MQTGFQNIIPSFDLFFPPVDNKLSMKGKIRTKERCPRCKKAFKESRAGLVCKPCKTVPRRFYLDLYWKGRVRLYSDKEGQPFTSYRQAHRALEVIRFEIDNHTFDPSKYVAREIKEYWFETQIKDWLESKKRKTKRGDLAPSYLKNLNTYVYLYYLPHFGIKDVREIRAKDIDTFANSLPERLSDKYRKNILDALENFFNQLVIFQVIERTAQKERFPVLRKNIVDEYKIADPPGHNLAAQCEIQGARGIIGKSFAQIETESRQAGIMHYVYFDSRRRFH